MMSFVKLSPPLEMESLKIKPIEQWIAERKRPWRIIPQASLRLRQWGCRFFPSAVVRSLSSAFVMDKLWRICLMIEPCRCCRD